MLRKLLALLLLLPLAARAEDWDDGQGSGNDEHSLQSDAPTPGDPRDGYGSQQDRYGQPAPPADQYGSQQYDYGWQDEGYGSRPWTQGDDSAAGPSMDDFRSGLDRYGRWVDTPQYGWVWQPTQVSYRWQPYWDGRWVWTTAGWTWVTDEPWGWATYHYGRWALVDGAGWVWLPGRVWAPAWVAWRWGGGYAGWCPLGPRGVVYVQPQRWVFVPSPQFLGPVRRYAMPVSSVPTYWARAQALPVARPSPRAGPPPRVVEQDTRVPVRAAPIVDAPARGPGRPLPSGAVPMWRPRTVPYSRVVSPAAQAGQPAARPMWREGPDRADPRAQPAGHPSGQPHAPPAPAARAADKK